MGRPVSRIHSPTSALDFVRDKVRNHAGGYPKMKILALKKIDIVLPGSARTLATGIATGRSVCPRRPLFRIQPGEATPRGGEFERENFHFRVTARVVSDFIPNKIQRACWGMNSGNRSAHSTTDTPSPKK